MNSAIAGNFLWRPTPRWQSTVMAETRGQGGPAQSAAKISNPDMGAAFWKQTLRPCGDSGIRSISTS
jgi:hypothetical protein